MAKIQANNRLLTKEQALRFASNRLRIQDVANRVENDRLNLLNDLTCAFLNTVPYQNITHCSVEASRRGTPTPEECVRDVLNGLGGMCWTLAVFMYELLAAIGYDVIPVLCSVATPDTNNHVVVLCFDVARRSDVYLVDVGYGYPSLCAVPLDFEEQSPVYQQSFQIFKYVKRGGIVIRMHFRGQHSQYMKYPTIESGGWEHAYYFKPESTSLDTIQSWMETQVYKNMTMFFNTQLRFVRFNDNRCIAIKGAHLLIEDNDGMLIGTALDTLPDEELVQRIAGYLPEVPRGCILPAIRNCQTLQLQG